jgi:uncharacterized membrane protein YraQ (UPF0718 family)
MFEHFIVHFCEIWLEMAPWLLAGFFLAFICSYCLSERWIRRHLGGTGWHPIVKASVMGLPLPICSCGVLLVALALRRSGAQKAPVSAFLASTPQSGTDALLVSLPLLGIPFTLLRFLGAFISGLVAGTLERCFGGHLPQKTASPEDLNDACAAVCACHHHDETQPHDHHEHHHHEFATRRSRLCDALKYAFIHLPGEIALLLTIGVTIATLIEVLMPQNFLCAFPAWATYGLAILIGLPTYACSLAIIPIAVGLISSGLSLGATFLFMMCAPTTHLGALLVLGKEFGWRSTLLFMLAIITTGLCFAIGIDVWNAHDAIYIPSAADCHHHCHHHYGFVHFAVLLPVILLFVHGLLYRYAKRVKAAISHA